MRSKAIGRRKWGIGALNTFDGKLDADTMLLIHETDRPYATLRIEGKLQISVSFARVTHNVLARDRMPGSLSCIPSIALSTTVVTYSSRAFLLKRTDRRTGRQTTDWKERGEIVGPRM